MKEIDQKPKATNDHSIVHLKIKSLSTFRITGAYSYIKYDEYDFMVNTTFPFLFSVILSFIIFIS